MNTLIKKTAIATFLATGMAGALTLQAEEVTAPGTGSEGATSMAMDMQDMQGMMGMMKMMDMSEPMGEMMTACAEMMEAHAKEHGDGDSQG